MLLTGDGDGRRGVVALRRKSSAGSRWRVWWLVVPAVVATYVASQPSAHPALMSRIAVLVGLVALGVFVLLNWRAATRPARVGLVAVSSGAVANGAPTLVLGGMPYLLDRARAAGLPELAVISGGPGHLPVSGGDAWWLLLADRLPVPTLGMVVSLGDLLLCLGLLLVVGSGTVVRPPHPGGGENP